MFKSICLVLALVLGSQICAEEKRTDEDAKKDAEAYAQFLVKQAQQKKDAEDEAAKKAAPKTAAGAAGKNDPKSAEPKKAVSAEMQKADDHLKTVKVTVKPDNSAKFSFSAGRTGVKVTINVEKADPLPSYEVHFFDAEKQIFERVFALKNMKKNGSDFEMTVPVDAMKLERVEAIEKK